MALAKNEEKLLEKEQAFLKLMIEDNITSEGLKPIFIPDHLAFGCNEGVILQHISVPPFESYIVMRVSK
jgi:hypothetical protein